MFTIADGRDRLYQWDVDVKLLLDDKSTPAVDEVHFRSKYSKDNVPIPMKVVRTDTETYVLVPNILLQRSYNITVYAYCCTSKITRYTQEIMVVARPKPADYVYTEEEVLTYRDLVERVKKLEEGSNEPALPPVTEEDNGKMLLVEGGEWNVVPSTRFVKNKISISSISASPSQAELGAKVNNVTLKWAVNMTPAKLFIDNVAQDIDSTSFVDTTERSSNKTWTLKVEDDQGESATKTASLTFLNGAYYGVAAQPERIDSAFILGLTKTLTSSRARTIDVNAGDGQYIWYAVPVRLGKCIFTVGGFTGGFDQVGTIVFTNASGYTEQYYVYRSTNLVPGATKVVIS